VALTVDIDPGMAGEEIEHMVEKADPGRDRRASAAVEVDRNRNVGFLGGAFDRCLAHGVSEPNRARCIRGCRLPPLSRTQYD